MRQSWRQHSRPAPGPPRVRGKWEKRTEEKEKKKMEGTGKRTGKKMCSEMKMKKWRTNLD